THKNDALSGDEFVAGVESENPHEDLSLQKTIIETLKAHPEIDSENISVHVKGGHISITGDIDSVDGKSTVEAMVENIEGVTDVVKILEIRKGIDASDGQGIKLGDKT